MSEPLLQIDELRTYFNTPGGVARAVDGVSLTVNTGGVVALVGESGCGKSMTALSVLQLVPEPAGYNAGGRILFQGRDLLDLNQEQMRGIRGRQISMIFQEPMTSLNPVFTIGDQIVEALEVHGIERGREAWSKAAEWLERVGIPNPNEALRQYPHQFSGGMRQRAMIAMALCCGPRLLMADEPTTALDVTVQAQILRLILQLQRETGMAMLIITHDLGIVAEVADRVCVMYAGQIVESASTRDLFRSPKHPYTQGLLASLPTRQRRGQELVVLEGTVPLSTAWPSGCRFEPRCVHRLAHCKDRMPEAVEVDDGHMVACFLYSAEGGSAGGRLEAGATKAGATEAGAAEPR